MTDQRSGEDRRSESHTVAVDRRRNPNAGRRKADDLSDLKGNPRQFITVTQAVGYMNREVCPVSRQTFYGWIEAGDLKATRIAREYHIRLQDFRWFLYVRSQRSA